ncbi:hypothetical protein CARUB_v10006347mg [Capsella rubella]|uniref:Uncharacterized protein n=1 Tax=Capsella rubella TaxID=81985 RepID=R0F7S1_9BRAS|nr:hypothetical protein CARUB_v10006347mg [Capsella rubella]
MKTLILEQSDEQQRRVDERSERQAVLARAITWYNAAERFCFLENDKILQMFVTEEETNSVADNLLFYTLDLQVNPLRKGLKEKMYEIQTKKLNTLIKPNCTSNDCVRLTPDYDALDAANKIGINFKSFHLSFLVIYINSQNTTLWFPTYLNILFQLP